ncbi:MAG: 4-(cytidine 5'-diphospho)-2-C-methyl-D-erythritol kinase [Bacteroidaceae bacterium]|nr:4-(cytidine 5'-diphospho)-2-C-methyl-D-erythritol kinase [Bacteroidaceae bacterium]
MNNPYCTQTCCKINLGLNIVERRPDGYHNLQTIFYPVPLYDELTIWESDGEDELTLGGHPLEGEVQDNLVLRAVRLLRQEGFSVPPLSIDLRKVIPSGAGLGGGSSDAACMVRSVSQLFGLSLSQEQMERLVGRLGADCPFFVNPRPLYAEGIGDVFTPISLSLSGWYLMLVKPEVHVSTREAYAGVHPHLPAFSLLETAKLPVGQWAGKMMNDFEESIFASHPLLAEIKQELYTQGAVYASMSGSGSTLFGLFRSRPDCEGLFAEHFCEVLLLG